MNSDFSTKELIRGLKTNEFIRSSSMPMGYVAGLPILCILNGNLCMKVPFLKYKITGEVDKTYVYPIKYVATVLVPENAVVSFEDMSLHFAFANVKFSDPIGTFRHEAVKDLDKKAYETMRSELYDEYDNIVKCLVNGKRYTLNDESRFRRLLNMLLEPSLRPFYKAINLDFANKYLSE